MGYLIMLRDGSPDGQVEAVPSEGRAVDLIEDFESSYSMELEYVLHVELINGRRVARDVTDEIKEVLDRNADEREREQARAYLETSAADFKRATLAAE